jgi:flagellar FliL protein
MSADKSSDKKETPAETPKKSKKKLMIIAAAAVVLLGGGGGAFFMLSGSSAEAAPKKGIVTALASDLTVNLTDGHYLKIGFSLQQTESTGETAVDTAEALNLAIDQYTGKTVAELSTENGRTTAKTALLAKIVKAYTVDGTEEVMDLYYTSFVTQ